MGRVVLGSAVAAKPNGTPSVLTATVISDTEIDLALTRNDTNGEGIKVYQSTDGVTYSLRATVAGVSVAAYQATGLTAELHYYFYVTVYKGSKESPASNIEDDYTYKWYNAGGAGANTVVAYQAVGAANAAASYVNLKNPGTYDLTPSSTPPTWNVSTGWKFQAARYFNNNYTPANFNHTVIISLKVPTNDYQSIFGALNNSFDVNCFGLRFDFNSGFLQATIGNDSYGNRIKNFKANYNNVNVTIAFNSNDIWLDGTPSKDITSIVVLTGLPDDETQYIGSIHYTAGGSPYYYGYFTGYTYSMVEFNKLLSYSEIRAITDRIKRLEGTTLTGYLGITTISNVTYSTTNPID